VSFRDIFLVELGEHKHVLHMSQEFPVELEHLLETQNEETSSKNDEELGGKSLSTFYIQ
jgi:hypothetical protein